MVKWGLKTSITLNLAFLLFFGMLMLDWVFITLARQALLDNQIHGCEQALIALDHYIDDFSPHPSGGFTSRSPQVSAHFSHPLSKALTPMGITALVVQPPSGDATVIGPPSPSREKLLALSRQAQQTGHRRISYEEAGWGLLFRTHGSLIFSTGMDCGTHGTWGVALTMDLTPMNNRLQRIQQFILIYIFLNGIILTLFGLHRLGRLTIKPLGNLVKRAETYQDDGEGFFLPTPRNNEFNILSSSLNNMLERIDSDREALNASVASLEQVNQELRKAQNDVIRAEKMASVGRLSAGIAHEIGNPVGIVLGYLELLKQEDLSREERGDCVARAEKEIGRIDAIIRQLLDFARPGKGEWVPIGIHGLLQEVAEVFQLQPLTAEIPLNLEFKADRDEIRGDSARLRQVFLNLMLNARDAIRSREDGTPGELTIETRITHLDSAREKGKPDAIAIDFIDNGIGVDSAQRESVFDPFFTTKAPGQGTGLGLAVSFTIVQNFGGTLEVHGRETRGTRMTVTLPLHLKQT